MQPDDNIRLKHMLDSETDLPNLIKALKEILPNNKNGDL